jgi:hypothetical protein
MSEIGQMNKIEQNFPINVRKKYGSRICDALGALLKVFWIFVISDKRKICYVARTIDVTVDCDTRMDFRMVCCLVFDLKIIFRL